MNDVPASRRRLCTFCAVMVDSNGSGTWQRATGWLPIKRYSGNKAGTNSLTLRKSLDEYACSECISKLKAGVPPGQMTIFEAGEYES